MKTYNIGFAVVLCLSLSSASEDYLQSDVDQGLCELATKSNPFLRTSSTTLDADGDETLLLQSRIQVKRHTTGSSSGGGTGGAPPFSSTNVVCTFDASSRAEAFFMDYFENECQVLWQDVPEAIKHAIQHTAVATPLSTASECAECSKNKTESIACTVAVGDLEFDIQQAESIEASSDGWEVVPGTAKRIILSDGHEKELDACTAIPADTPQIVYVKDDKLNEVFQQLQADFAAECGLPAYELILETPADGKAVKAKQTLAKADGDLGYSFEVCATAPKEAGSTCFQVEVEVEEFSDDDQEAADDLAFEEHMESTYENEEEKKSSGESLLEVPELAAVASDKKSVITSETGAPPGMYGYWRLLDDRTRPFLCCLCQKCPNNTACTLGSEGFEEPEILGESLLQKNTSTRSQPYATPAHDSTKANIPPPRPNALWMPENRLRLRRRTHSSYGDNFINEVMAKRTEEDHKKIWAQSRALIQTAKEEGMEVPAELHYYDKPETSKCLRPAYSQGKCGSCWAFASLGALEKQICERSRGEVVASLSREMLVRCSEQNNGCSGGNADKAYEDLMEVGGVFATDCLPYQGKGSKHCPAFQYSWFGQGSAGDTGRFGRIDQELMQSCEDHTRYTNRPPIGSEFEMPFKMLYEQRFGSMSVTCPAPSSTDKVTSATSKGCPNTTVESCLAGNIAYSTLQEAWDKCGEVAGCAFITAWTDGKFYLRRASDPDTSAGELYAYAPCSVPGSNNARLERFRRNFAKSRSRDKVPSWWLYGEEAMKTALMKYGAIYASYNVRKDFKDRVCDTGCWTPGTVYGEESQGHVADCGCPNNGHAVHVIGYGTDIQETGQRIPYWLAENSWGDEHGSISGEDVVGVKVWGTDPFTEDHPLKNESMCVLAGWLSSTLPATGGCSGNANTNIPDDVDIAGGQPDGFQLGLEIDGKHAFDVSVAPNTKFQKFSTLVDLSPGSHDFKFMLYAKNHPKQQHIELETYSVFATSIRCRGRGFRYSFSKNDTQATLSFNRQTRQQLKAASDLLLQGNGVDPNREFEDCPEACRTGSYSAVVPCLGFLMTWGSCYTDSWILSHEYYIARKQADCRQCTETALGQKINAIAIQNLPNDTFIEWHALVQQALDAPDQPGWMRQFPGSCELKTGGHAQNTQLSASYTLMMPDSADGSGGCDERHSAPYAKGKFVHAPGLMPNDTVATQRCPPPYRGTVELKCVSGVLFAESHNCSSRAAFGRLSTEAMARNLACAQYQEGNCTGACEWDVGQAGCVAVPLGYFKILRGVNYHGIEEGASFAIAEMSRFMTSCPTTGWTRWSVCNASRPCERGVQERTRQPLAGLSVSDAQCSNLEFFESRPCVGPGFCPEVLTRFVKNNHSAIESFMAAYKTQSMSIGRTASAGAHMLPSPYPNASDASFWCSLITGDSACSMYFEGHFEVKEAGEYTLMYKTAEGDGELEFNTLGEGQELKPQYLIRASALGSEMFEWQDVGFHHRRRRTGVKPWQRISSMNLVRGKYFTRLTRAGWAANPLYALELRHVSNVYAPPTLEGVGKAASRTVENDADNVLGGVKQKQVTWRTDWGVHSNAQRRRDKTEVGHSNELVIRNMVSYRSHVYASIPIDKLSFTADELYNLTGLDKQGLGSSKYHHAEMNVRATLILPAAGDYKIRYLQSSEWDASTASWRQESRRRYTKVIMRLGGSQIGAVDGHVGAADVHGSYHASESGPITLEVSSQLHYLEGISNKPVLPNYFTFEMKKEDLMHGETLEFGTATPYMADMDALVGDSEVRIDWPDRSDPLSSELRTQTFQPLEPNKLLIGIPEMKGFMATAEAVIDAGACLSLEAKADHGAFGGLALILCDLDGKSQYLKLVTYTGNATNEVGWVHIGFNQPTHLRIMRRPSDLQSFEISYRPDDRDDFAAPFNTDAVRAALGSFAGDMSVGVSMNGPEAYRYAEFYNISIEDCPSSCNAPDDQQLYCGAKAVACGGALNCPETCSGNGGQCQDNLCLSCPDLVLTPEQEAWECGTIDQICHNPKGQQIQFHKTMGHAAPTIHHVCLDHVWSCIGTTKWEYLLQGLECGKVVTECGVELELFDCPRPNDQCVNHKCECHPTVFPDEYECGWAGNGCGQNVTFGDHGGACGGSTDICQSDDACNGTDCIRRAATAGISSSTLAGTYVEMPGPVMKFALTCSAATSISLKAEIIAPNGQSDSYNVTTNGGDYVAWNTGQHSNWGWSSSSPSLSVDEGLNELTITKRESGIKVKTFELTVGGDKCQWLRPETVSGSHHCCTPKTADVFQGLKECGRVSDGCGGVLTLPTCAEGFGCKQNACEELTFEPFIVDSGPCVLTEGGRCVSNPHYGIKQYDTNERCTITAGPETPLEVVAFDTESYYDWVKINGKQMSGRRRNDIPQDGAKASGKMYWHSDGSVTRPGWKICVKQT
jgi:hypothetical protein